MSETDLEAAAQWNRRATQPAAGELQTTWLPLTAAGQLREGDKIRFRFGQETLTKTVAMVLDAGTEREEVVYNRKRNFYFITSKALTGTSSAKEVEVLRTVAAPPAAAHGDEAVLPERRPGISGTWGDMGDAYNAGWNDCLDRVAAMRAEVDQDRPTA